jgi:hypothetical protein
MNDLTLICEICRFPIEGDTGAIYATFPDINAARAREREERHGAVEVSSIDIVDLLMEPGPIHWRTGHYAHPEVQEVDSYEIDAVRIATWPALAHWTAHLMEKNWFALSDWDDLLREVAGEIPSRRIRVAAKEAA